MIYLRMIDFVFYLACAVYCFCLIKLTYPRFLDMYREICRYLGLDDDEF